MIQYLFEFGDWIVAGAIVAFFMVTGSALVALGLLPAFQARAKAVGFAMPDLLTFLGVLFGLNIGFLGAEIEDRIQKAASAIGLEGNAFHNIASTLRQPHAGAAEVRAAARSYLRSALEKEFTGDRPTIEFASSSLKMEDFVAAVTVFADTGTGSEPLRGVILEQALTASQARAARVALMGAEPNELRWYALLFLLVLIQAGIVLVDGVEPRRMISHMCLISLAGAVSIAVAAVSEDPFTPPRMVSVAPLKGALAALDAPGR